MKEKNLNPTYWPTRRAQTIQSSNERQVILLEVVPLIASEMQLGRQMILKITITSFIGQSNKLLERETVQSLTHLSLLTEID